MIHGKYFTSQADISPILALRKAVFCDEQGFDERIERDASDDMAYYALVYDDEGQPAATGRLYIDEQDRFHIGRMCTRRDLRGRGYGDLAIRMLLDLAVRLNAPYIVVHSQLGAIGFYEKYGFRKVGAPFMEEGADHQCMRAEAADVLLSGSCGGHCPQQT